MPRELAIIAMSFLIIAAFLYMSYQALFGFFPIGDEKIFNLVYGSANLMTGIVINYWFGSSKSSSDKDKTITAMMAGDANRGGVKQ